MFLIILSLNCFYTRFIPYKLISFKFRFIPLLFHPLSFFFFFTSRQTMQQSHTCIYKTQGTEKRNFLHASVQLRSLPFYIVAIWISVTSANHLASKSSPFVPALQRAFTGRQCGNQHCSTDESIRG